MSPARRTPRARIRECCGCCSTAPSSPATADVAACGFDARSQLSCEELVHGAEKVIGKGSNQENPMLCSKDKAYEMNRRDLLRLSAAGVVGASVSGWFQTLASRAAEEAKTGAKHKSCILLWMDGGPAQ